MAGSRTRTRRSRRSPQRPIRHRAPAQPCLSTFEVAAPEQPEASSCVFLSRKLIGVGYPPVAFEVKSRVIMIVRLHVQYTQSVLHTREGRWAKLGWIGTFFLESKLADTSAAAQHVGQCWELHRYDRRPCLLPRGNTGQVVAELVIHSFPSHPGPAPSHPGPAPSHPGPAPSHLLDPSRRRE